MSEKRSLAAALRPAWLALAILAVASVALATMNVVISEATTASASVAPTSAPSLDPPGPATAATPTSQPAVTAAPQATVSPTPWATTAPPPTSTADPTSTASSAPTSASDSATWTFDLYDPRAVRWQDPDLTACTAASAQSMLNIIAYAGSDPSLIWKPTNSFGVQESILRYERAHMTMRKKSPGSDPHGWRNALNFFGWGSAAAGVYRDSAYSSLDGAAKAVVSAIAEYHKPVGVITQGGAHAEFVTGYRVVGDDPSTGSSNFRIVGVYLTDPWRVARYRDSYITYARWRWGFNWLRFVPYWQTDSTGRDPIDGKIGRREWYGKWVVIEPVR